MRETRSVISGINAKKCWEKEKNALTTGGFASLY